MNELEEYEGFVRAKAKWGGWQNVVYPMAGLAGEAGEVVDRLKKLMRGTEDAQTFYENAWHDQEALLELGDCLYYLTALAHDLGFTMQDVIDANVEKLTERHKTAYYKIMERGDA